ncbi:NAD kinase [Martelella endophytica]|uniref:NAD kinase n=1 Tax=Martelella endophytica TaxID=1486262 RepID=A0A0D5LSB1_MAREN|nr:NAD kinase [Martelella endophytica]AJY47089.1 inorganic polyphosphate kinase [Martelella endophytica]
MSKASPSLCFTASEAEDAQKALGELTARYGNVPAEEADYIVALGGDGFMLQTLHELMNSDTAIYGMNRGSVGFLMNEYSLENLHERLEAAVVNRLRPLRMTTENADGTSSIALAINEVSLLRQSHQAAKLRVNVDGRERLPELACDGILVATPAGSTAYNLSVHGPIIPLEAPLLAITPISAFRPRRWRGALLPNSSVVDIEVLEPEKRWVNAFADHTVVEHVLRVRIEQDPEARAKVLSDPNRSWSERILAEQFSD